MSRLLRSGRSASSSFVFLRERPGPPIHSKHPYSFADVLDYNNTLVLQREDYDVAYRGMQHSLSQCPDATCIIHFYPDGDCAPAPATPPQSRAASLVPDTQSDDDDSDNDGLDESGGRAPSPTVTELGGAVPPLHRRYNFSAQALAYSGQRGDLGQERWARYFAAKDKIETLELGVRLASKKQQEAARISNLPSPPRKSRRQRQGKRGDLSEYGVMRADVLQLAGFLSHDIAVGGGPRAIVDRNGTVMGVTSRGPSAHYDWKAAHDAVFTDFRRLKRNGEHWRLPAGETRSRFGLTSGFPHDGPAFIPHAEAAAAEIAYIQESDGCRMLAAFQTHLMQQFFPHCFAVADRDVAKLLELRPELSTPFPESPFTTSEISFGDAPMLSYKNRRATFYFVEALTAVGKFNDLEGGQLVLPENDASLRFGPGFTAVLAATTEYRLAAVAKDEERFLFRQFFCAGVLRWAEKGGRTDAEFDEKASEEEKQAWEDMRLARGYEAFNLFSELRDIDTM
ncbi:hypothetical protein R3P38DRAFT_2770127 [Favolaschia claudopus]|uniref:Uncharacterized protein n=1 Tax=Favolaschia claudopus TaxID=2862362 RepID=A0AAW0CMA7_9AGAR